MFELDLNHAYCRLHRNCGGHFGCATDPIGKVDGDFLDLISHFVGCEYNLDLEYIAIGCELIQVQPDHAVAMK